MSEWPDYGKEDFEIWEEPAYEVYDPWLAQVRGTFLRKDDAEAFKKLLKKKWKKERTK